MRTRHLASVLGRLAASHREDAQAIEVRRAALATMRDGLAARQATLVSARAARTRALAGTRSGRVSAQRALSRLIAERQRAASQAARGPGGPWAIPWPIVQCESGGQNLPPNSAGASGYCQMLPATWKGLGGSTPHAYQASKAEQDQRAATLWAGGAAARATGSARGWCRTGELRLGEGAVQRSARLDLGGWGCLWLHITHDQPHWALGLSTVE